MVTMKNSMAPNCQPIEEVQHFAPLGSWEIDVQTNEFRGSESFFRIVDWPPSAAALPFDKVVEVIPAADRARLNKILKNTLQTQEPFDIEHQVVRRDGTVRVVRSRGQVVAGHTCGSVRLVSTTLDFTECRLAEEALHRSQALTNAIIESTSDMVFSVDPESLGLLTFNRNLRNHFLQQYGIRLQIGMSPEDLFPTQDYVDKWRGYLQRALSEGPYTLDYIMFGGSGVLQLTFNLLKRDGKVFGISVIGKDITEGKRAEEALRQSEEKYRSIVLNIPEVVWTMDSRARFVFLSPRDCLRYGRPQ
jgi:PAS domain-containing protein